MSNPVIFEKIKEYYSVPNNFEEIVENFQLLIENYNKYSFVDDETFGLTPPMKIALINEVLLSCDDIRYPSLQDTLDIKKYQEVGAKFIKALNAGNVYFSFVLKDLLDNMGINKKITKNMSKTEKITLMIELVGFDVIVSGYISKIENPKLDEASKKEYQKQFNQIMIEKGEKIVSKINIQEMQN